MVAKHLFGWDVALEFEPFSRPNYAIGGERLQEMAWLLGDVRFLYQIHLCAVLKRRAPSRDGLVVRGCSISISDPSEDLDSLRAIIARKSCRLEELYWALFEVRSLGQWIANPSHVLEHEEKLKREVKARRATEVYVDIASMSEHVKLWYDYHHEALATAQGWESNGFWAPSGGVPSDVLAWHAMEWLADTPAYIVHSHPDPLKSSPSSHPDPSKASPSAPRSLTA
ncbi:hypothetical protein ACLOJK_037245 [Asimina triloba]